MRYVRNIKKNNSVHMKGSIRAFTLQNSASVVNIIYRVIYINAKILFKQNYEEIALEKWEGIRPVCVCVCFQIKSYKRLASSSAINGYRMT